MCRRGIYRVIVSLCLLFAGQAVEANVQNTFAFPDDPFAVQSTNDSSGWIKFLILTSDTNTVYFQNSNVYPFHYDFATTEMAQFIGMTPSQFDNATLYLAGQQAVLGAVVLPPLVNHVHALDEYGIQFVGQDAFPPTMIRDLFDLVVSKISGSPPAQPFYFPTFEQLATAQQNQAFFDAEGIAISSPDRWATNNTCYSHGWAVGELKFFAGDQIATAYLDGNLAPGDILLTDVVPSEIPYVSGVLTLSAATPNSHVAILAQTYSVPFAHVVLAGDAAEAQALAGRKVALRAVPAYFGCDYKLVDVENELDAATIDEIMALKLPGALTLSPVQTLGAYSDTTAGLQLADIRYFGGKAANFGFLRRSIPASSPKAGAFSFDLWDGFMDQTLGGGNTLRQEIAQRLAPHATYPPPHVRALSEELNGIQALIEDTVQTTFSPAAEAVVLAALQDPQYGFEPTKKIRFRSSTNFEDSDKFTGAGLFDSKSGCLADELDGDAIGPGQCDPTENNEKGVFRALRKVFASFYYDNAYLERLRHGVLESQVAMGVLFHHSFPDPIEMANGVATLRQETDGTRSAYLVSQAGASSVTNPEPGAIAEEVDVAIDGGGQITPTLVQQSNLVPLGQTVMELPADYIALTQLLLPVADEFEVAAGLTEYTLEFEFKEVSPGGGALPGGGLVVKQVRRIPEPDQTPITPFLIDEPATYCTFQGETSNVYSNHRAKTRVTLESRNMWLTDANLQAGFYERADLQYAEGCQVLNHQGPPTQWPGATHSFAAGLSTHSWTFDTLQNPRTYQLATPNIPTEVLPEESPLIFPSDLTYVLGCVNLQVDYQIPVINGDLFGGETTTTDIVWLCGCPEDQVVGLPIQQRTVDEPGVFDITTSYYWPPPPGGVIAGYTAPLVYFEQTVISGLTSDPIVLTGEFSQTYRPEHHNFGENFIFEPGLDPGLTPQQRLELEAAGLRVFYVFSALGGGGTYTFYSDATWGDECLGCTDLDSDGRCASGPLIDCDDGNPAVWSTPGEVRDLLFVADVDLGWSSPADPGAILIRYDVLRSGLADDFLASVCVETDGVDEMAVDSGSPGPGSVFYYLVRAENACPNGGGPLGEGTGGAPRSGPGCP